MYDAEFWEYVISALLPAINAPFVLLLLPQWKVSVRKQCQILLTVELIMLAEGGLVFMIFGPSHVSALTVSLLALATVYLFLIHYNSLRDGRLAFLLVTIIQNTCVIDVLTSTLYSRDCPQWLLSYVVLGVIQYLILYRYCRKPLHKMLDSNYVRWGRISVIPISLTLSLMIFHMYSMSKERHRTALIPAIALCITVVLIYVSLYYFQQALLAHGDTLQYNALLQSELHFLEAQDRASRTVERKIRIFRHDTRHYLGLMQGCLEQGNTEAAMELLNKIKELTDTTVLSPEVISYTGNPMIDAVLNQIRELAKIRQVAFEVRLALPAKLRVDVMELAVVLSNALENAVHAAAGDGSSLPKKVSIESRPCNQELFLIISNTFSDQLPLDAMTGLPSTQEEGHGYGTLSIYNFAQKYGCALDFTQKNGTVCLRLLI